MDATERQEIITEPSVGIVPVLLRYGVGFSTALVPQLQLWHPHGLVSVRAVGEATFTCFIVVILHVSRSCCCDHRNISSYGRSHPGKPGAYSSASVPAKPLLSAGVKRKS